MTGYSFAESYPGPRGRHLGCLTKFTLTRDETKRGGESIHPRVINGRTFLPVENTRKARSPERKTRLLAALADHCSRHPNDKLSAARMASTMGGA